MDFMIDEPDNLNFDDNRQTEAELLEDFLASEDEGCLDCGYAIEDGVCKGEVLPATSDLCGVCADEERLADEARLDPFECEREVEIDPDLDSDLFWS